MCRRNLRGLSTALTGRIRSYAVGAGTAVPLAQPWGSCRHVPRETPGVAGDTSALGDPLRRGGGRRRGWGWGGRSAERPGGPLPGVGEDAEGGAGAVLLPDRLILGRMTATGRTGAPRASSTGRLRAVPQEPARTPPTSDRGLRRRLLGARPARADQVAARLIDFVHRPDRWGLVLGRPVGMALRRPRGARRARLGGPLAAGLTAPCGQRCQGAVSA